MTRQDLRNRTPKFKGVDPTKPYPKPKRDWNKVARRVAIALGILVLLAMLWESQKTCERINGPNSMYCVD